MSRFYDSKIIFYVAAMLSFRQQVSRGKVPDRQELVERMSPTPEVVIDGLLERFTEQARASSTYVIAPYHRLARFNMLTSDFTPRRRQSTSATQTNLLSHMLALCLKVDNFACEPTLIASDLQMAVQKYAQFICLYQYRD